MLKKIFQILLISTAFIACHVQKALSQDGNENRFTESYPSETGLASWYGPGLHQSRTAKGELFDMEALTAAHPTLPFNTKVRVTHQGNQKTVIVRINDRGPFIDGRVIDLSKEAARRLGMLRAGVARVKVEVVE